MFSCTVPVATAQLVSDFRVPTGTCVGSELVLVNESTSAISYQWDFCHSDLKAQPNLLGSQVVTLDGTNLALSLAVEYDRGAWFGFVSSRSNNRVFRLDYGASLDNAPTVNDLGNIGGMLNGPQNIELVNEGGAWYGLLINTFNSTMIRLVFPTGLNSIPTVDNLGNLGTWSALRGMDLVYDGSRWVAAVTSYTDNKISLVDFGNSILNTPSVANVKTIASGDVQNPLGIGLLKQDNQWFGVTSSNTGGKVFLMEFGSNLLSTPEITPLASFGGATEVAFVKEGINYHAFVMSQSGQMLHLDFGTAVGRNPLAVNLGNFGVLRETYSLGLVKATPAWYLFTIDYETKRLFKFQFNGSCQAVSKQFSAEKDPSIRFNAPGVFNLDLSVFATNGEVKTRSKLVTVVDTLAEAIQIQYTSICVGTNITFSAFDSLSRPFSSVRWVFDEFTEIEGESATFTPLNLGELRLFVSGNDSKGCFNSLHTEVTIFPPPAVDFSLPAGLICTNNQLLFTCNMPDLFDGNLSYQWYINNDLVGTQRDLMYTFTTGGGKDVKLVASIPGCSDEVLQTISSVGEGPAVDFLASGQCAGEEVSFTNQSTGNIAGFTWDLSGTPSIDINPVIGFSDFGDYAIKLKATGTNGCVSEITKPLVIYSKPAANFSLALPPFSCAGSPAQFTDTTPALTDSNLATWAWSFGTGSAVSTQQNPTFTYTQAGDYNVGLTVTSDQGCANTIQKPVTILQSPTVDFTNGSTCRNQPTQFTSNASTSIKSYQWTIGTSTYTLANPTHIFAAPGNSAVQLRVVAQNDCVASITKSLTVPAELAPDFAVANACAGQPTTFTNNTSAPNDPVQKVQWTINNQSFSGSTASVRFANAGSYPIGMLVTAQSGCQYTLNRNVVINPTPRASFSVSDDVGPAPLKVLFTNTSQGATSYLWRFNDRVGSSSAAINPEFVFNALGSYGVDLVAFNAFNCSNQITQQVRVVTPLPDLEMLDYRLVRDPLTQLLVNQIDIKNNSNYTIREAPVVLNVGVGVSFREVVREEWRPGTTKTVTLQNQLQTAQPLSFACAELVMPGDLQAANNKICIPLSENTVWLAAYPNPADRFLTVPLITNTKGPITLRLINGTGALAYQKTVDQAATGLREWTIPVDTFAPGLYTLVVQSPDGERLTRVLIHR